MSPLTVESASEGLLHDELDTPVGRLVIIADEGGNLRALGWTDGHTRMEREIQRTLNGAGGRCAYRRAKNPCGLTAALEAYFGGELTALETLRTTTTAGTEFQRAVWGALRTIPVGETLSYGALAARIGRPAAVRAVGLANGANPIAIVVPCHRVIGANGTLTGYGGGLDRKRWLLNHESRAGRTPSLPFVAPPAHDLPGTDGEPIHRLPLPQESF